MKIFVVNLIGKRATRIIVSCTLVLVILLAAAIGLVSKVYGDRMISASAGVVDEKKIVIIDAGHGGEDSGAVGVNGALEKDLNLQMALEVGRALEEKGYVVVYTRTDDRLLYTEEENVHGIRKISDLKNRCKVADRYPGAVFVSLHMNSFGAEKYSGLQVYYSEQSENSRELADKVQNKVVVDLQKDNNRVIKSGKDMYILSHITNPAILIECGFLTNKAECEKLSQKEYQKQLSFSIVCGIIEYIEGSSE